MDEKTVSKKSEKIKFGEGLYSHKKKEALEFIRKLRPKEIGTVLGEGDVMYNDHLDCFFVWKGSHLVRYINEKDIPKPGQVPRYVEQEKGDLAAYCDRCGVVILDAGFIQFDDGRRFHYNPKCWPTKATASKE